MRKDKALIDAKWMEYSVHNDELYLCRDCAHMVAQSVLDEY